MLHGPWEPSIWGSRYQVALLFIANKSEAEQRAREKFLPLLTESATAVMIQLYVETLLCKEGRGQKKTHLFNLYESIKH